MTCPTPPATSSSATSTTAAVKPQQKYGWEALPQPSATFTYAHAAETPGLVPLSKDVLSRCGSGHAGSTPEVEAMFQEASGSTGHHATPADSQSNSCNGSLKGMRTGLSPEQTARVKLAVLISRELVTGSGIEDLHLQADKVLVQLLTELGHSDIVSLYNQIPKRYS